MYLSTKYSCPALDGTTSVRCHKNCVSKYVSPSTLANMSKRVNDDNESDDPEVGTKRMRSSTACAFEFMKHCLFCPNVTTCKLLHEYDDKVPHQYRIRFFPSEFVLSRGKVLGLDWYRRNQDSSVASPSASLYKTLALTCKYCTENTANIN